MATNDSALKAWIKAEGSGAQTRLFKAIIAEMPTFSMSLLSEYVNQRDRKFKRFIPFEVAVIISRHTGIPLSQLEFKYVHKPGADHVIAR